MKPLKLTLTGFAGIRAGSGKESLTLDLESQVPSDAVLVAIVGPNGAGKSTIMDNLHPYRIMPSRSSSYSPTAFSFYDQLYGDEGKKELEFEHAGIRYRSILQFQSGKRRKTEAYLFVQTEHGEDVPASAPDGMTSDGKTDTYDKVLESIMGSPETFFTSVFSAQSRKPLSSYGNAEIKTLMAELLGLDSIRSLNQRANEVQKTLKAQLLKEQETLQQMQLSREAITRLNGEIESIQSEIQSLTLRRSQSINHSQEANKRLSVLEARLEQSKDALQRSDTLKSKMGNLEARTKFLDGDFALKKGNAEKLHNQSVQVLKDEIFSLEKQMARDHEAMQKMQALLSNRDKIQSAVAEKASISTEIEQLQAHIARKESAIQEARHKAESLQKQISDVGRNMSRLGAEGESLKKQAETAQQQASRIDEVPCAGTDLSSRCPLLGDARQAKERIAPLKISLDALRQKYREAKHQLESQEAERHKIVVDDPEYAALKTKLQTLHNQQKTLQKLAMDAALLEQAETRIQELQQALENSQSAIQKKNEAVAQWEVNLKDSLTALEAEFNREKSQVTDDIALAKKELDSIELPDISDMDAAKSAVETYAQQTKAVDLEITNQQNRLVNAKANLQSLSEKSANPDEAEKQVALLNREMGYWSLLGKALGNDGIVSLSIDDVGPTLSGYANDLLMAAYGPRFTLSIQTQTMTAKGEAREGFDILVFDANTQEGKSVDKMSGGERVWINEAMTRAIALFLAKESGQTYSTLFTDEADGALDPDRKRRFMAMKRQVLTLGNYEREYFVSQTPELWEMADYQLDVTTL